MYSIKVPITRERISELATSQLIMSDLVTERERALVSGISMDAGGDLLVEFSFEIKDNGPKN